MRSQINIQRIAIDVGEILKWSTPVNEINRLGQAILTRKISPMTPSHRPVSRKFTTGCAHWAKQHYPKMKEIKRLLRLL
jgi:hypothetical protein